MSWLAISLGVCFVWWLVNLIGSLINSPDWGDSKKRHRFVWISTERHYLRETRADGGTTQQYTPDVHVYSGPKWLDRAVGALMLMRAQAPYVAAVLALAAILREVFG